MRSSMSRIMLVAFAALALAAITAAPASAHQHRHVNGFDTTVGWADEPAFAGFPNAVSFAIERPAAPAAGEEPGHTHEEPGKPVANAKLQVEVIFGDQNATEKTEALALESAFGAPGEYEADLIPTDSGTYTFHIFGTVGKVAIDEFYTSGEAGKNDRSEGTYNDVNQPETIAFPRKAPTNADLDGLVLAAGVAADDADGAAKTALYVGIAGLTLGLIGIMLGLTKRKGSA